MEWSHSIKLILLTLKIVLLVNSVGIAALLTKRLNEKQYADQVIIFNIDNCNSTNKDQKAVVKFYIAVNNSTTTPSQSLTVLAGELLAELIEEDETVVIGPNFGKGTVRFIDRFNSTH